MTEYVLRLEAVRDAAARLRRLCERRDQMVANDTWESIGAIRTYKAILNAETRLFDALDRLDD